MKKLSGIGSLLALALSLGGCAASSNNLTMISEDHRRDFKQVFSHAYAAMNANGDYDVVLVHDANADSLVDTNGAVNPAAVTPRQIVHIRVYWLPQHGAKFDHVVSTNASIRWFVFGDRGNETANLLEYSGSGLVLISPDGYNAAVTVRGAYLKLISRRGQMADPLGPSSVTGTITAQVDRGRVEELLGQVKAADQVALAPAAAAVDRRY